MTENNSISSGELRQYIEQIERLTAEKKDIATDISELFSAAKGSGFDVQIMRQIIKERAMDAADRQEQSYMLDTYRRALGMLADTPLGEAAIARQDVSR